MTQCRRPLLAACALLLATAPSWAQSSTTPPRPDGRVSFYVTTDRRSPDGEAARTGFEFATAFTFRTPHVWRRAKLGRDYPACAWS